MAGALPIEQHSGSMYDPEIHHRRSIRVKGYDYSQAGAYFITMCVRERECLLGEVVDGKVQPSGIGAVVEACWRDLPRHYAHVDLGEFVIMPNHVHGIIILTSDVGDNVGAGFKPAPTKRHGLTEVVRAFKTFSTRRINVLRETPGLQLWQRNYYERIIRDEAELGRISQYIVDNPARWLEDEYHAETGAAEFIRRVNVPS